MTPLSGTYAAYLTITLVLTVYLAQTLHHWGRPFLVDVFHGNVRLAEAVNHLLVVGFYLTNAAFVTLNLKAGIAVATPLEGAELLSVKLGVVLFTLGIMHFVNLIVLTGVRRWVQSRCPE